MLAQNDASRNKTIIPSDLEESLEELAMELAMAYCSVAWNPGSNYIESVLVAMAHQTLAARHLASFYALTGLDPNAEDSRILRRFGLQLLHLMNRRETLAALPSSKLT